MNENTLKDLLLEIYPSLHMTETQRDRLWRRICTELGPPLAVSGQTEKSISKRAEVRNSGTKAKRA